MPHCNNHKMKPQPLPQSINDNDNVKFEGVPNNVYPDCPALMSDGRFITNYLPNCEMNFNVSRVYSNKPLNSWEYTFYLNNEAQKAGNYFNNIYKEDYSCPPDAYKIIQCDSLIWPL